MVPVLPPAGQPIAAFVPVPPWMFCSRISVAFAVTPSSKARVRLTFQRAGSSERPSGNVTFVIAVGRLRMPPEAIVAYALAISSGEQQSPRPPSVSAGTASSGERMPMSHAACLTLSGPRSSASWM